MRFSLIIPVYNEAEIIVPTLSLLAETFTRLLGSGWEIIVVDNASTDDSAEKVVAIEHSQIRAITLKEKGKGRAVRKGFSVAQGNIVGFTDADLPITPEAIVATLLLCEESMGVVHIGSRFHTDSVMPNREWWRISSSRMFNILAQRIVGVGASDTQCPLKFVQREHIKLLLSSKEDTWFFDLEFIALLEGLGVPIREIPVTWSEHRYPLRRSKLSATRDGARGIFAMFRIRKNLPKQLSLFQQN